MNDMFVKNERIKKESVTVSQMIHDYVRERLMTEIRALYACAFPKMSEELKELIVRCYFEQPAEQLRRQIFLFRNESGKLIAASRFDFGNVEYDEIVMKGLYFITYAIMPEYQKFGLGKTIATSVLEEFRPDILFVTCIQSRALHSWIGLRDKGLINGYEAYPRLEQKNDKEVLITIPYKDLDFAIKAFEQMYRGVLKSRNEGFDKVARNLTVFMVRKSVSEESYDFDPWEKDGREDKLAKALGVTAEDGVLVIFKKNQEL